MAPLSPLRVTMQLKNQLAENTLSSVNTGLPSHLIEHHNPWPAYTTHTAPVVKMLVEQDKLRKATSIHVAGEELVEASPEADWEEQTQGLSQPSG
ncbi:PREDICTED: CMT1A duplicated region transcript 4 protein, partial [Tinamus guttatus]|uniref:CMT1A duplicated region transcript 4 protein n=1 Tax=Tinamus guttatus TaxID=94827 RepID=UPI00052E700E